MEVVQPISCPILHFPGLEIRLFQRRVLQDGEDVSLTRLEYSTLVLLASNPGIVLTRTQIFEAVWNMDSDSCQSSISTVICNLRKKIEPDSKNPTYIKIVLGVGYKFNGKTPGNDDRYTVIPRYLYCSYKRLVIGKKYVHIIIHIYHKLLHFFLWIGQFIFEPVT